MSRKILVTRRIPKPALDLLREHNFDLEINEEDRVMTKAEIKNSIKDKDGLLCLLTDSIDREIIHATEKDLQIIANYAVGYNNIDVEEATKAGVPVTNTPGVLTETTADFTMALLLAIARKIVESDQFTRAGKFKGWGPMLHLGTDVYGKTLGIIGCGRIGSAVAKRAAKGFRMKILYYDHNKKPSLEEELAMEFAPLEKILKEADFISLHVPLTDKTFHLIGKKELAMMKSTAYLINTSRGAVIDEEELVKCLQDNKIAGAALDVFEHEPKLTPDLNRLDNVIITAHIGSATIETRTKMGLIAAKNIIARFNNEEPPNCVNPEVLV